MKLIYKILLVNIVIALIAAIFTATGSFYLHEFTLVFGIACLVGGAINILISIILFIVKETKSAQGFLIAAGVVLLISSVTCSVGFRI